jgi:hypothetical protein
MRSSLRAVLFCGCFLDLISLHQSIAQDQRERKKEIPPAIAQEMHELQTILSAQPSDPAALFNLALDYATIGDGAKALVRRSTNEEKTAPCHRPANCRTFTSSS